MANIRQEKERRQVFALLDHAGMSYRKASVAIFGKEDTKKIYRWVIERRKMAERNDKKCVGTYPRLSLSDIIGTMDI